MRFSFTEDQRLLAEAVREVLEKTCPPEVVRSGPRPGPAWRALAEVGLLGAHVAEDHGGLGLTPLDTVLAFEETGWFAVPGPLVETAVAAPLVIPAERHAALAAGDLTVSVASPHLPDADLADLLVAGTTVVRRDDVTLTEHRAVDATRKLFTSALDGAAESATARRRIVEEAERGSGGRPPEWSAASPAFDHAALATAAQLVGIGRRLMREAVGYAGQRRQFGQVIGSFQAVKHQLADVAVELEFAAPLVHRAAYSLTHRAPTAARDVSAAKLAASEAAHHAARAALQVHGAIGYTDELDLQLWLNRVWALRPAWGDDAAHRARLRSTLLDEGLTTR